MLRLTENSLTPEIYRRVRASVGMKEYDENDVKLALQGTLFSVVSGGGYSRWHRKSHWRRKGSLFY